MSRRLDNYANNTAIEMYKNGNSQNTILRHLRLQGYKLTTQTLSELLIEAGVKKRIVNNFTNEEKHFLLYTKANSKKELIEKFLEKFDRSITSVKAYTLKLGRKFNGDEEKIDELIFEELEYGDRKGMIDRINEKVREIDPNMSEKNIRRRIDIIKKKVRPDPPNLLKMTNEEALMKAGLCIKCDNEIPLEELDNNYICNKCKAKGEQVDSRLVIGGEVKIPGNYRFRW